MKNEAKGRGFSVFSEDTPGCNTCEDKDIVEVSDRCGNTLSVRCEGAYITRYNGKEIARCKWHNGMNKAAVYRTADECKYHSGRYINRDPEGKGEPGDEGKEGTPENPKYDFWWYNWDFINEKFDATHYYGPEPEMVPGEEGVVKVEE